MTPYASNAAIKERLLSKECLLPKNWVFWKSLCLSKNWYFVWPTFTAIRTARPSGAAGGAPRRGEVQNGGGPAPLGEAQNGGGPAPWAGGAEWRRRCAPGGIARCRRSSRRLFGVSAPPCSTPRRPRHGRAAPSTALEQQRSRGLAAVVVLGAGWERCASITWHCARCPWSPPRTLPRGPCPAPASAGCAPRRCATRGWWPCRCRRWRCWGWKPPRWRSGRRPRRRFTSAATACCRARSRPHTATAATSSAASPGSWATAPPCTWARCWARGAAAGRCSWRAPASPPSPGKRSPGCFWGCADLGRKGLGLLPALLRLEMMREEGFLSKTQRKFTVRCEYKVSALTLRLLRWPEWAVSFPRRFIQKAQRTVFKRPSGSRFINRKLWCELCKSLVSLVAFCFALLAPWSIKNRVLLVDSCSACLISAAYQLRTAKVLGKYYKKWFFFKAY